MDSRLTGRYASLGINVPMPPPHWALLERELLRAQEAACAAFYAKYFDERGYLLCIPRWGGNDGPDDAGENLLNWPMLHALGASDSVLAMYKQGWDGHLRQYSEAKTVHVPMAREGMYYKEFSVMFDWMHHGEWISPFILQPLSDPGDHLYEQRIRRYAGFYMDEDPQALNYDPEHNLIRSMFNGSRGPMLRKSTALDWAGDPIEVAGRFDAKHGENSFAQMLDHFRDYNDVAGDHPLNLAVYYCRSYRLCPHRRSQVPRLDSPVRGRLGGAYQGEQWHHTHEYRPGRYHRRRVRRQMVWRRLRLGLLRYRS